MLTQASYHFNSASRLLQELRAQHQALDLVGTPLDLIGVVGEVNASDHGAALQHRGGALQLRLPRLTATHRILLQISRRQQFD